VGGNVKLKSGEAAAVIQELVCSFGDVDVAGSVKMNSGVGKATHTVFAGRVLTVGNGISLLAPGGGTQSIVTDVESGIDGSLVRGAINMLGGHSASLLVNGDVRGPVNISMDKTAPMTLVQIGSTNADSVFRIDGPVTVKTNSRIDGLASAGLINVTVTKGVTLQGGAGIDQFYWYDAQASGAVKIDAGAGDDEFIVESSSPLAGRSAFLGTVTVKGGAGNDEVKWSSDLTGRDEVLAAKLVTIDGGAGTDTFTVGNVATFLVQPKILNLA
jgi:hypothetical protein